MCLNKVYWTEKVQTCGNIGTRICDHNNFKLLFNTSIFICIIFIIEHKILVVKILLLFLMSLSKKIDVFCFLVVIKWSS